MKQDISRELQDLLRAVEIDSEETWALGRRVIRLKDTELLLTDRDPPLVRSMTDFFYRYAYCRRLDLDQVAWEGTGAFKKISPTKKERKAWLDELESVDVGAARWEEDWILEKTLSKGRVEASRGGLMRQLEPGEYLHEGGPNAGLNPGTRLRIYRAARSSGRQEGFYFVFGEEKSISESKIRLYWNLRKNGACSWMADLCDALKRLTLPFEMKILNRPDSRAWERRDSAVLYLEKRHLAVAFPTILRVYEEVAAEIDRDVPLFTREVRPGLGFAEDPGESFGLYRCRLVAQGVYEAFQAGQQGVRARSKAIASVFARKGLDLDRPELGSKKDGWGEWLSPAPTISPAPTVFPSRESFLDVAHSLGAALCREALVFEERCTWLEPRLSPSKRSVVTLSGDLYRGLAGIAIFLSRLYAGTGEEIFRRTALRALEQAWQIRDEVAPQWRASLFSGWTGLVAAFWEAGILLEHAESEARGRELFDRLRRENPERSQLDVIVGSAGTVVALLALYRMRPEPSLLDLAERYGGHLLREATKKAGTWSWATLAESRQGKHLCGLAHGVSGIVWAFLELFAVTGKKIYRRAACGGLLYEQTVTDPETGLWPDLRVRRDSSKVSFLSTWCHGAAGIGWVRHRALEVFGPEWDLAARTERELEVAAEAVWKASKRKRKDFSLCHGQAGRGEMLLAVGRVEVAESIARRGMERHHRTGRPWSCGAGTLDGIPGLMLGQAGIGHFYLRLADPKLPSLLFPTRWAASLKE